MEQKVTSGVRISVETFYQEDGMSSHQDKHFFAYQITVENHRDETIKLISRKWFIFDSLGESRIVEGEGVVGEQPDIQPGQIYQYVSGVDFTSEIGQMHGYYTMVSEADGKAFNVEIPLFIMMTPAKMN